MTSPYIIQDADKTRCYECNGRVDLLCDKEGDMISKPAFYICWKCKRVAHIGRGHVKRGEA